MDASHSGRANFQARHDSEGAKIVVGIRLGCMHYLGAVRLPEINTLGNTL